MPAYRGTAYVVFEDLPLGNYGNRIPQLSFEVFRPLADPDTAEGLTQAVTMIPASGEFAYATQGIRKGSGGSSEPENLNVLTDTADMVVALDRLQAMAPKVESVSLVVAWLGDDLRAGNCKVRPGAEVTAKTTTPSAWSVNGVSRANAFLVNRAVGGATRSKHMEGAAFDIAMSNHDPVAFEAAARAVGFLGFGFYPRSGLMHVDLGPVRQWGNLLHNMGRMQLIRGRGSLAARLDGQP